MDPHELDAHQDRVCDALEYLTTEADIDRLPATLREPARADVAARAGA